MFLQDFENFANKLRFNDTLVYNIRIIFGLITGETLVTEQDFENWFTDAISELGLVEDLHYRYREAGDINSVVVRGTVGLNLLLREQSPLGSRARDICGVDRVPMREPG